MATLISYLRLILFLGGVLVGVQVPFFVDQYGKSLEAHFLESQKNLSEFQENAQKFFGGDMQALISHYRENGDPVFRDGGKSIQSMYARFLELEQALEDFNANAWRAFSQAIIHPVAGIRKEVLENYSYAIKLNPGAIAFGIVAGLFLALLGETAARGLVAMLASLGRRWQPMSR